MSNINKVIAGLKFFKEKLFNGIFREHIGVFDDAIEIIENAPENRKPCEFCCDMKSINEVSEKFDISVQYCPVCGRKIPSGGIKICNGYAIPHSTYGSLSKRSNGGINIRR